jgi:hypothetical protein
VPFFLFGLLYLTLPFLNLLKKVLLQDTKRTKLTAALGVVLLQHYNFLDLALR